MKSAREPVVSNENERTMMRDAIRSLLQRHWPAAKAVEFGSQPGAVTEIWKHIAQQGYSALGADFSVGGLQDILIVMEELGRAACSAPMLDAAIVNLAFAETPSNSQEGEALIAGMQSGDVFPSVSFGELDPDSAVG